MGDNSRYQRPPGKSKPLQQRQHQQQPGDRRQRGKQPQGVGEPAVQAEEQRQNERGDRHRR